MMPMTFFVLERKGSLRAFKFQVRLVGLAFISFVIAYRITDSLVDMVVGFNRVFLFYKSW